MIVTDIKIYVRTVDSMNIIKPNKSVELSNICFQFLIKIPITTGNIKGCCNVTMNKYIFMYPALTYCCIIKLVNEQLQMMATPISLLYVVSKMSKCIFMLNKYSFFKPSSGKSVSVLKELISLPFLRPFYFDKILVIKGSHLQSMSQI